LTKMYLSQVGIDPETGMPDIGPVTTGMTHTQQNRASLFLKTLEEMLDESKGEDVELEKFKEELAEKGMGEAEFERLYRSFLRDGEIFEPSPGKVNYVGRRKKYERRSLGREVQAKKARRYG
ncbi:MAG: hypothetical protein RAK25_05640, partial [TACK group archaeon]|nr:hypothetical protein [TACK group archaeon]